jgi:hypothetical protein
MRGSAARPTLAQDDVVMPKKIDPELRARAVRLVSEHRGESTVLLSGMSGRPKPPSTRP